MSSPIRTIYVELRASAEKLQADMAAATTKLDKVGTSGREAGRQIATGMDTASVSFGKVARNATEAALAAESFARALGRYTTIAAASGVTTERLVDSYRLLRVALSPTPFTVATIATGVLAETTIKLVNARARLIEQQALMAAKGGRSASQVELLSGITSAAGGNQASVLGLGKTPQELAEIANRFAAIEDPAERAALAVQLFGEHAGDALRELTPTFANAAWAASQFGVTLNATARKEIDGLHRDLQQLGRVFTDWSVEKTWAQSLKTLFVEVAAAYYDMSKRVIGATGSMIDKITGIGGIGKPGTLSPGDIAKAGARQDDVNLGLTADELNAQAQLARFRQGQTLEGRRAAQAEAQGRADAAYSKLNDGTQRTGQERFLLANEQGAAQQLATAIGLQIKALEDSAEAQRRAKEAAEKLAAFQSGAADRLNSLFQSATASGIKDPTARAMYEGRIEIGRDADKTTPEEKSGRAAIATQQFRQVLAAEQQKWAAGVMEELDRAEAFTLGAFGKVLQKNYEDAEKENTKQRRVAEIQAEGASQPAEAKNSADKLQAERDYGLQIGHTFQQRLAYMQKIAQLDNEAAQIKIDQAQREVDTAKANNDEVRAAEAQLRLDKAITDQKNQQAQAQNAIDITKKDQSFAGRLGRDFEGMRNAVPAAFSSALGDAVFGGRKGESAGKQLGDSMKNLGKGMFDKLVEQIIVQVAGLALNTTAITANTAAQTAAGAGGFAGTLQKLMGPFMSIFGFADGTDSAPGGWSLVGERGPELMNVPRGAQIIPHHALDFPSTSDYMKVSGPALGGGSVGGRSTSISGGNHTFHIYEVSNGQETARQVANYLRGAIPNAAPFSS
jgi:hypothetical protein